MAYYECIGDENKYKPTNATLDDDGVMTCINSNGDTVYTQTFTNNYNSGKKNSDSIVKKSGTTHTFGYSGTMYWSVSMTVGQLFAVVLQNGNGSCGISSGGSSLASVSWGAGAFNHKLILGKATSTTVKFYTYYANSSYNAGGMLVY